MNNEFKKSKNNQYTVYTLESATSGGTSAGSIASVSSPTGGVRKRGDNLIAQEGDKDKVDASKPRNFVAKNAKMGGAGAHKDKKKAEKQGDAKHKKPFDMAEDLKDPKDNPCWKGYKPVGTKNKGGRTVPNCVPKEGVAEGYTRGNPFNVADFKRHMDSVTGSIMGRAPTNKYQVGQVVKYQMEPAQEGGSGVGKITRVSKSGDHYEIDGSKIVNHYEIKGVEQGVAEGLSKRDQQDVAAIKAAIARLESQLNHPNADKAAIQQSIAHEKKRLALYGVTEAAYNPDTFVGKKGTYKGYGITQEGPYQWGISSSARKFPTLNAAKRHIDKNLVAEGPGFDKWADDRAASQLHKLKPGMVQDRKTGKWYDPKKEFDKKMNSPEVMAQMKRMAQKEGVAEGPELKKVKREYNQAAKDAGGDWAGAGKKIDNMKKGLRQKDVDNKKEQGVAEDHEIQMASNELQSIAKNAESLLDMVRKYSEQDGLEAWQQSKITKAADYLNSVLQSVSGEQTDRTSEDHSDMGQGYGRNGYHTAQAQSIRPGAGHNMPVAEDDYMAELFNKLAEKIPANAPVDVWVKDFQKADPNKYHQFKNKTPEKKAQMAVAASYGAKNPSKKK